jgi:hypothetical protein
VAPLSAGIAAGSHWPPVVARLVRLLLRVLLAAGLCGSAWAAVAQDPAVSEHQIKAAYLFKFGAYVEWPPDSFRDAASPIVIGVAGDPALAQELERVIGSRTMNGRAVEVRQPKPGEDFGDLHILFLGRSQIGRLGTAASRPRPMLIVTDSSDGLGQGSVINFVSAGNRVRFEVSLDAAKRNSLKIAAPLLAVAMKVQ